MLDGFINNEITDSLKDYIKKRVTTPIWGTFFVFWLIFHWEFVFTIFFVNEDLILARTGYLKNDYLRDVFFDVHNWYFWFSWAMPIVLTGLSIWVLPRWLFIPAFKKDEEYKTAKRRIRISEQRKLEEEMVRLEGEKVRLGEESVKQLKLVSQKTEEEKKIMKLDPSLGWLEEYNQFRSSIYFNKFKIIIQSIYEYSGNIHVFRSLDNTPFFSIPKDILAFAHSSELININPKTEKIDLTDKGKFFVKKYSFDQNK